MNLCLSILESIYIIYMFNYFKTSISIKHPLDSITQNNRLLNHTDKSNKICPLGNLIGFISPLFFIGRHFFLSHKVFQWFFYSLLIGTLLLNWNAFLYLLPIFYLEKILNNI